MRGHCWSTVYDAGTTVPQHWVNVSCLHGSDTFSIKKNQGLLKDLSNTTQYFHGPFLCMLKNWFADYKIRLGHFITPFMKFQTMYISEIIL